MSRVLSTTAFAAAAVAFMLPFGLVSSCDGAEVRFTGTELVTYSVPAGTSDADLRDTLERRAGPFATAALLAAAVGLALSILGRSGAGVCAGAGLVAMQLLLYAIVTASDGSDLFIGFGLALCSFAAVGVVSLIRVLRARRRVGRTLWPPIGKAVAVLLPPVGLAVAGIAAVVVLLTRAALRGLRPRRATC
jgi:hypothetical protein